MDAPSHLPPRSLPNAQFQRTARLGRALALAGAAVFVLNALGTWLVPGYAVHIIQGLTNAAVLGPLTPQTRVMVVLWDIPSLGAILMALFRLWQLFGEYLQSRIFGARALASLRSFTRWLLLAAVMAPIYRAVLSVLVTLQNGPGRRELNINLCADDYLLLLVGVAVLAVSSVMAEAARIAEDNEGFV